MAIIIWTRLGCLGRRAGKLEEDTERLAACDRLRRRELSRIRGYNEEPPDVGGNRVGFADRFAKAKKTMPKYKNSSLGELAHQLTLSPRRLRVKQIAGVDRLLDLVDVGKSYPYDLVCFHITGTRPLIQNQKNAIGGDQLVADLPTLAEHVTRKSAIPLADLPGEYNTHDEVSAALEVSTKTLRRWRARGLLGLRAVFDDGVSRLVFSRSAVKRFKDRNRELVERGASFKLLTDVEKDHIIELARMMLADKREKLYIIARAIAADTGRAVETIRYTLRQFDLKHPTEALFAGNGEPVVSQRHVAIWQCHERGETPRQIARAFGCDVASIRSVLRELEARRLKLSPIDYIDNDLFHAPNAEELILGVPRPAPPASPANRVRVPKDMPGYLRALYLTPLLSREQEADLFRRFNYMRCAAARAIETMDIYTVTDAELNAVGDQLERIETIKQEIIQANLRLVVSIAKRHVGRSDNLFEVISDGNVSLMRAVEKFDFSLGNKFSTYGSWAIMKNFARSIPENHYHMRRYVTGQDEMLDATADRHAPERSQGDMESIREALTEGLEQLDERERTIVTHHFGLFGDRGVTTTLEELGKRFGVTKERVRQIEKRAIGKLRDVLSPTLLDAIAD